jgi:hypothetical protein
VAFVPLVPLTPNLVNAPSQPGFVAPNGLSVLQTDWKPAPQQIRLSSFPTPLAVLDATRLALEEPATTARQSEFALASEILLSGLVQGIYGLRWLPLAEIDANAFRTSLKVAWRGSTHCERIGLIERTAFDSAGNRLPPEVVGVVVDDLVPAVSARFIDGEGVNLTALRQHVVQVGDRPDVAAALLRAVREPLERSAQWQPNQYRWMALVDRVIAKARASVTVDLCEDVRSAGPFHVPVPRSDGAGDERQSLYVLCSAPGFAKRLANALLLRPRTAADAGGSAGLLEFVRTGSAQATATFTVCSARALPSLELGEGCVAWLDASGPPLAPPQARQMLGADALRPGTDLERHVRAIHGQLQGVDDVALNAATRLTDVARVVALYAPEFVGWSRAVDYSPRYDLWASIEGHGARPSKAYLADAVVRGRAFVLEPASTTVNAAAAVFLEDAPTPNGAGKSEIADLSVIGLALWMAFNATPDPTDTWGARWSSFGPVTTGGAPLLDTKDSFALTVPTALSAFFADVDAQARIRSRAATLQRFLRAYPAGGVGFSALLALGARRFVHRVLGSEGDVDALVAPGAGLSPGAGFLLTTAAHGGATVYADPLRSN